MEEGWDHAFEAHPLLPEEVARVANSIVAQGIKWEGAAPKSWEWYGDNCVLLFFDGICIAVDDKDFFVRGSRLLARAAEKQFNNPYRMIDHE